MKREFKRTAFMSVQKSLTRFISLMHPYCIKVWISFQIESCWHKTFTSYCVIHTVYCQIHIVRFYCLDGKQHRYRFILYYINVHTKWVNRYIWRCVWWNVSKNLGALMSWRSCEVHTWCRWTRLSADLPHTQSYLTCLHLIEINGTARGHSSVQPWQCIPAGCILNFEWHLFKKAWMKNEALWSNRA